MEQQSIRKAIFIGGMLGGALDLLFAVSLAGYHGIAPGRVFQTIASGFLGSEAYTGGIGVKAFGMACHFALSLLWACLFAVSAWRLPALARRPLISGTGFGIFVFLCMRLVVLPLSAYPRPVTFNSLNAFLGLLAHIFLFGLPIAVAVGRSIEARIAKNNRGVEPVRGVP